MRRTLAAALVCMLSLPLFLYATPGTFRGVVVRVPDSDPGWIYVKSVNGQTRRVGISRAKVEYSDMVPASKRAKMPELAIAAGVELRITAEQDDHGEWRASRIEILKLTSEPDIQPSERSDNLRTAF